MTTSEMLEQFAAEKAAVNWGYWIASRYIRYDIPLPFPLVGQRGLKQDLTKIVASFIFSAKIFDSYCNGLIKKL